MDQVQESFRMHFECFSSTQLLEIRCSIGAVDSRQSKDRRSLGVHAFPYPLFTRCGIDRARAIRSNRGRFINPGMCTGRAGGRSEIFLPIDARRRQIDAAAGGASEGREATSESFGMDLLGILPRCDVMADGDQNRVDRGVDGRDRIPVPVVDNRSDSRGFQALG